MLTIAIRCKSCAPPTSQWTWIEFSTGRPGCTRHLQMLLAKTLSRGLIAGITQADRETGRAGRRTSTLRCWKEVYVYFDMPEPAYGIQLVYNNTDIRNW